MGQFNKEAAKTLREEINEALKPLAKKYGVTIRAGNCSFSETDINYRLEVQTLDQDILLAKERKTWDENCEWLGFVKEDIGKSFPSRGDIYEIVGLETGRSKYDLKCKRKSDGKILLFVSREIAKRIHPEKEAGEKKS